ncbi:16S rRNA (guanine(966)-N(2))-methyltransferase RsmD [Erysipelothrix sp. HDW6C]|uniref:16S rRNA (guanine(966)-N(2))-methyltransferase RsmD n=1 Tax=Erysipelothrix sp. HDW6C TaxID=2714930 RepID=UPI001409098F|nr:16S rRNA (guanine(966)-N(2))-methyltransferase RsmD [Erysipelothrix sp. HDW6C]QIK70321.1 16S rRNA (guanine(966)-N(2))-methyltransferase RsmD [Erysipelothrix sp. HDW6C]
MRIVAGTHGSRALKTLKGNTTRPTSDKIRGAIFSKIGPYFDGGRFLDVFGGSGAMSLEAISRGMEQAVVFEKDNRAAKIIMENVMMLNEADKVVVKRGDAKTLVNQVQGPFEIVFMDPPYAYPDIVAIAQQIVNHELLSPSGLLILETDSHVDIPETLHTWSRYDRKEYGATTLHYYHNACQL